MRGEACQTEQLLSYSVISNSRKAYRLLTTSRGKITDSRCLANINFFHRMFTVKASFEDPEVCSRHPRNTPQDRILIPHLIIVRSNPLPTGPNSTFRDIEAGHGSDVSYDNVHTQYDIKPCFHNAMNLHSAHTTHYTVFLCTYHHQPPKLYNVQRCTHLSNPPKNLANLIQENLEVLENLAQGRCNQRTASSHRCHRLAPETALW